MSDLPHGWTEATVLELAGQDSVVTDGDWVESKDQDPLGAVRLIQLADIGDGFFVNKSQRYMNSETVERLNCTHLDEGDVLIARMPDPLGRACIFPDIGQQAVTAVDVFVWRPDRKLAGAEPRWLMHTINSPVVRSEIQSKAGGTTRQRVAGGKLKQLRLPMPPLPEQRRIAVKVDGLTARTARARKELDRIPPLISRYKQRLLALAFSGELTAGWRKANPSLQTALEKVRFSRKGENRLARRKRSASFPDYDIPSTWDWISPDEVAADAKYSIGIGPFGSNLVRTDYRESGVRLVFVRDIRRQKFEDSDARYVDESKAAELHQHIASPGDVLITKMGDPPGDSALFPMDAEPAVITADCIKLTPHDELSTAKYLNLAIRSEIVQGQFKAITAGVAQQKVSLDRFRQLALPIAPLEEQAEIVRRIESAFGWLDRMAADHAAAARLVPKLDAAILAKAFRGELVPQDPSDEPAAKLLKRIKEEREATPKVKRGRKANLPPITGTAEITLGPVAVSATGTVGKASTRAGKVSMTKSRQDDDVKGEPYLAGLLKSGRYRDAQSLFRAADLPVADFYKQLAWEIDKGHILDNAEELKAA